MTSERFAQLRAWANSPSPDPVRLRIAAVELADECQRLRDAVARMDADCETAVREEVDALIDRIVWIHCIDAKPEIAAEFRRRLKDPVTLDWTAFEAVHAWAALVQEPTS